MRTTNSLENINRQLKRRTCVAGLFPNEASLLRLVSALLMEWDEEFVTGRTYLNVQTLEGSPNSASSYRKIVALPSVQLPVFLNFIFIRKYKSQKELESAFFWSRIFECKPSGPDQVGTRPQSSDAYLP